MGPSVFKQGVDVIGIDPAKLFPSPRNYNPGMIEFGGRRLLAYRTHRMDKDGHCAIAITELDDSWQPTINHWIEIPRANGDEHLEDPRLFLFKGELHVAFSETRFHHPQPYTCVMKYGRLTPIKKGGWKIDRIFQPRYGNNHGGAQEKNWQFFEHEGRLLCIYSCDPHVILDVEGESVVNVHTGARGEVFWPWGEMRGGTPPIRLPSGDYLTIFHSSVDYPEEGHYRRYFAAAYTFEGKAPFRIMKISHLPILSGSKDDGHAADPRKLSWKPFVVFPCGIIPHDLGYYVSYGINDHQIILADHRSLGLGDPLFKDWMPQFFTTNNHTRPIKISRAMGTAPTFIRWEVGKVAGNKIGVMDVRDPKIALVLTESGFNRSTEAEYAAAIAEEARG